MKKSKWGTCTCALSLMLGALGCTQQLSDENVAVTSDELYVATHTVWQQLSIPVCWVNPGAATAQRREWARTAVVDAWEANSKVRFTGWGTCPASSTGLRINIVSGGTDSQTRGGVGRQLNGLPVGLDLNLNLSVNDPNLVAFGREPATKAEAVHEFGHVLGYEHEQDRDDSPCVLSVNEQDAIKVGGLDPASIMSACNPFMGLGVPSGDDVIGHRFFYGFPDPQNYKKDGVGISASEARYFWGPWVLKYDLAAGHIVDNYPRLLTNEIVSWPAAWSQGVDAVVNYGNGKLYMFRGSQYIRYGISTNKAETVPKSISSGWPGWPVAWTSIDAVVNWGNDKIYFFRGADYLRYDISEDRVDQQPRAISPAWTGLTFTSIDSVVHGNDGNVYFFKGDQYQRFNVASDSVNLTRSIVGRWPGLPF